VLIVGSVAVAVAPEWRGHGKMALAAAALGVALYGLFLNRIRRAHFSWGANALALFGLPIFSYLLLRSGFFHKQGRVRWKGRTYGAGANQTTPKDHLAGNQTLIRPSEPRSARIS
jgi:hypothetical protein